MKMRWHASDPAWEDLSTLSYETPQNLRILVVDLLQSDVDPAPRHDPVGPAEVRTALSGFGLHKRLLGFAVESMTAEERIIFLLFQTARSLRTLFIAPGHVARSGFALRLGFGAFESDDFLSHKLFLGVGRSFFFAFLSFDAIVIGQAEE